jgi:hypothetical protein
MAVATQSSLPRTEVPSGGQHLLDPSQVTFDAERAVADAGLV